MNPDLPGWNRLRHGGLLLDTARLAQVVEPNLPPLDEFSERRLRKLGGEVLNGSGDVPGFTAFVLDRVCGFDASLGQWRRGSQVPASFRRRAVTGEMVRPRQLWTGPHGAQLPVFFDAGKRVGIGHGRRVVSQALGWLRAGKGHLALLTNGRQWRLLFAGLDFDAWCEWDLDLWFEEGGLSLQVTALRTLLRPELWMPEGEDGAPPLLKAVRDTRKGQAELSEVLGERVREAVEILIRGHGEPLKTHCPNATPEDIYHAACRVAMRLVVILFAEARDLLPRDNPIYQDSYGLNGLLERLERDALRNPGRVARDHSAWPRILSLFRLVHEGSHHPELPVPEYGGELFAPGNRDATGLSQALWVFENGCFEAELLSDAQVHELLQLLTRTRMRIRQGRAVSWVAAPVDFSDLSTEYIGILYEGLLDYELKPAPDDDAVVFLSVGDQPALPLSRLEAMDDKALKALFRSLKDKPTGEGSEVEEAGQASSEAELAPSDDLLAEAEPQPEPEAEPAGQVREPATEYVIDLRQEVSDRAEAWARRAVLAAGMMSKPRGKPSPERRLAFDHQVGSKARQLLARTVLPGEWYLVRWGGTRKGKGTFHTRPGLAVPTMQRTLRPLAYDPPSDRKGEPDRNAPPSAWTPKTPEAILDLKVCDPACGSGTFPLAALRFLTDALYASLLHHKRIQEDGQRALVRLLGIGEGDEDAGAIERPGDELIPCLPDDDDFEPRLRARLRRYVVERCVFAVDVDPLSVELCRLSLWIETMDRELPFGFLDHKIKCGNALIGTWFDQFQHYPAMAWKNRDGGDRNHGNGEHFRKNERTRKLKDFVEIQLKPHLRLALHGPDLFQDDLQAQIAQAHRDALQALTAMHAMPVQDAKRRSESYRRDFLGSKAWRALKDAMDLWCACWFWPIDEIENAPLPSSFTNPSPNTRKVAAEVAAQERFFHWELEFPDVFREPGAGFDAVLGNPPWDIAKPVSKEFFSNIDPLYRSYGKQEALRRQRGYFQGDAAIERDWLDYNARFRAQSNFMSHAASPFGDPDDNAKPSSRFTIARGKQNFALHHLWREARSHSRGFADARHPFRHQGSADLNLYKLFLEGAHGLLREGGRLGFVVPSGLYSDHGTGALRTLFLEHCQWEWLFGIENRLAIFPIHRSYKFNPVVIQKGGATDAIRTAFMRRDLEDWERAEEVTTHYGRAQVVRFSPKSRAILEIQSQRDLEILEKIYANSVLLGDDGPDGWGIKYTREFDMTNDSHLFPPRPQWEAKGYRPDEYSRWLKGDWRPIGELWAEMGIDPSKPVPAEVELEDWLFDTTAGPERREAEKQFVHGHLLKPGDVARTNWRVRCAQPPYDSLPIPRADLPEGVVLSREADAWIRVDRIGDVALPLYEGRMVNHYDWSDKAWVSGRGRSAEWRTVPWGNKVIEPQYLISHRDFKVDQGAKLGFLSIGSSTNSRSFYSAVLPNLPCGNSVGTLRIGREGLTDLLELQWQLASYVFDYVVRLRLTGLNLNFFVVEECPVKAKATNSRIAAMVTKLSSSSRLFSAVQTIDGPGQLPLNGATQSSLTNHERMRLRVVLDAMAFADAGLQYSDITYLLSDCDLPNSGSVRLNPKGFWRVDQDDAPELRQTVLAQIAFCDLEKKIRESSTNRSQGMQCFVDQNQGEGWMLPEVLRLTDYSLGTDSRAAQPQPVAKRFGPRFYDWQLTGIFK
ncbi:MAG: hypothetical protein OXF68_07705 [Gammaproteobacteria bacterium]|nr:hypothetical protein [Gammaproteobacteria bacterium]